MHFVFGALSDTDRGAALSTGVVVIGLGNDYRRDDGVGPIIAAAVNDKALPGVRVVTGIADPMSLVEAWSPATLAVLVDAAITSAPTPGRIHRCALKDVAGSRVLSSHALDVSGAIALGEALDRLPNQLVILTVEVADTAHGVGLTPKVAAAVPEAVAAVAAEITRTERRSGQGLSR